MTVFSNYVLRFPSLLEGESLREGVLEDLFMLPGHGHRPDI